MNEKLIRFAVAGCDAAIDEACAAGRYRLASRLCAAAALLEASLPTVCRENAIAEAEACLRWY